MLLLVLLPLPPLLSLALRAVAADVARRHSPRTAATGLVAAALVVALATGLMLCALATLTFAEMPAVARLGHWSRAALDAHAPVPALLGLLAGGVAAALLASSAVQVARGGAGLVAAERTCRELGPAAGGLVVVDDPRAAAYAVPGLTGRIVVTNALLRQLDARERRAVLAHETSHLRHRHYLYVQLADLAAAANPLLRPVTQATRLAVERWADEDAAAAVGDRVTVARALAKAGLARHGAEPSAAPSPRPLRPAAALPVAETELAGRVRSLVEPAGSAGWALGTLAGASALAALSALLVTRNVHRLLEAAQAAYFARH